MILSLRLMLLNRSNKRTTIQCALCCFYLTLNFPYTIKTAQDPAQGYGRYGAKDRINLITWFIIIHILTFLAIFVYYNIHYARTRHYKANQRRTR
jgi:hypothetical protein